MTEVEKLRADYRRKAAEGLVDVRFYVVGQPSLETACAEVNRLNAAVAAGLVRPFRFNDTRAPVRALDR